MIRKLTLDTGGNWADPTGERQTQAVNQYLACGCSVQVLQLEHVVKFEHEGDLGPWRVLVVSCFRINRLYDKSMLSYAIYNNTC